MEFIPQALRARALRHEPGPPAAVLVAGAGGALGAEIVERLLASRAFAPVRVLATQAFRGTVHGLEPVLLESLGAQGAASLAIVAFDRERRANGRDAAFLRPEPHKLPALAARLHAAGVRDLLVVMPHAAAAMPDALKAGLASLDEQAVAAIGFDRLAILRSAQSPAATSGRGLQRVADLVLAQLRVMAPQPEQPVRARKVAQIAVEVARLLPSSPPGTRVLPPQRVWQAAQLADPAPLLEAWLAGRALPEIGVSVPRM